MTTNEAQVAFMMRVADAMAGVKNSMNWITSEYENCLPFPSYFVNGERDFYAELVRDTSRQLVKMRKLLFSSEPLSESDTQLLLGEIRSLATRVCQTELFYLAFSESSTLSQGLTVQMRTVSATKEQK